jgi:RNA polymerase sigma-70 factor (ECF subfamily)
MTNSEKTLQDSDVVYLVIKGEKEQFAILIERYESKLIRYAQFLLKDYDNALDVVQESFIKAYVNLNSFNHSKSFSSWIYRITHNEAINFINKNKRSANLSSLDKDEDEFYFDNDFDEHIDKMFLKKEVKECIAKLDLKYQEVILLFYFEHLSYDQISDILHIPKSTVGVRVSRAKLILKKICSNIRSKR